MTMCGWWWVTHRSCVDKDDYEHDEQDHNNGANDVPLVELPNDELEGLPWRREPQERGGRATRGGGGGGRRE